MLMSMNYRLLKQIKCFTSTDFVRCVMNDVTMPHIYVIHIYYTSGSDELRNDLERPTKRSQSISVEMQVIFNFHFQKTLLKFVSFRLLHKY